MSKSDFWSTFGIILIFGSLFLTYYDLIKMWGILITFFGIIFLSIGIITYGREEAKKNLKVKKPSYAG